MKDGTLKAAAEEILGVKYYGSSKKKTTPWWGAARDAVKEKMTKFRRWMKTRNINDRLDYEVARRNTEGVKRRAKDDCWRKIGEDLEADMRGTKKLVYSMVKSYRKGENGNIYTVLDKNGNLLVEQEDITNRWRECFEELLNVDPIEQNNIDEAIIVHPVGDVGPAADQITEDEITSALRAMIDGKAAGEDDLSIEIVKCAGPQAITWLKKMFNTAYNEERIPDDWTVAAICPIYKNKGQKTECGNQSNCCLCLDEGWHLEEDNECFSRCHCSCQVLLGIYSHCARVLFSCLDVYSHFSPVVA